MGRIKILCLLALYVGYVQAAVYGGTHSSGGGGGSYGAGINYPPQPYGFDYQARDEQGNVHYRQESGDAAGVVRGSYGYTDNQGLYRVVDYVADANGFRASVRTNEPGTGKDAPADVNWTADPPPAGIYDRYTRHAYRPAASYPVGAAVPSPVNYAVPGVPNPARAAFTTGAGGYRGGKGAY